MDDRTFDDPQIALEWIRRIESAAADVRESDIYPRLREWVDRAAAREILDIGCGQGACSDRIGLGDRRYTGLDPSPRLIERAKELYPHGNRRFVLGSAYGMPFADGSFDAAFSVSVWHLLSDPGRAALELGRVLKEEGRFQIITANPDAYPAWTDHYAESRREGIRFEGVVRQEGSIVSRDVLYLRTLEEILGSLRAAGLIANRAEPFRADASGQYLYVSMQGRKPRPVE